MMIGSLCSTKPSLKKKKLEDHLYYNYTLDLPRLIFIKCSSFVSTTMRKKGDTKHTLRTGYIW